MIECQFLTFHGWGFDASCWAAWEEKLKPLGSFSHYDRGYFGYMNDELEMDAAFNVAITHSMGLHWLDAELLEGIDFLIITGGFLCFHPYAAQYKRRSRLVLNEMINEFENDPQKVLSDFYQNCFAPESAPAMNTDDLNHRQLIEDLRFLNYTECDINLFRNVETICVLHGAKDRIVPNKKGRQIYNMLQEKAKYFELKSAGHALPFTHSEACIEFIQPEIESQILRKKNK